jgi:DNA invertase Pin-like site-specific DNA recombinase
MTKIGYARVSSSDQNLEPQIAVLSRLCDDVRAEKVSGTSMDGREELKRILRELRPGDEFHVVRLDRLARSLKDLMDIAEAIKHAGASLHVSDQNIETKTSAGKLFFAILGAISQFETEIRRDRQMAGIALAKANGVYKGSSPTRAPKFDRKRIAEMRAGGMKVADIAREIGSAQFTVRRVLHALAAAAE